MSSGRRNCEACKAGMCVGSAAHGRERGLSTASSSAGSPKKVSSGSSTSSSNGGGGGGGGDNGRTSVASGKERTSANSVVTVSDGSSIQGDAPAARPAVSVEASPQKFKAGRAQGVTPTKVGRGTRTPSKSPIGRGSAKSKEVKRIWR